MPFPFYDPSGVAQDTRYLSVNEHFRLYSLNKALSHMFFSSKNCVRKKGGCIFSHFPNENMKAQSGHSPISFRKQG